MPRGESAPLWPDFRLGEARASVADRARRPGAAAGAIVLAAAKGTGDRAVLAALRIARRAAAASCGLATDTAGARCSSGTARYTVIAAHGVADFALDATRGAVADGGAFGGRRGAARATGRCAADERLRRDAPSRAALRARRTRGIRLAACDGAGGAASREGAARTPAARAARATRGRQAPVFLQAHDVVPVDAEHGRAAGDEDEPEEGADRTRPSLAAVHGNRE